MGAAIDKPSLRRVSPDCGQDEILRIVREDGGVVIEGFLPPEQLHRFNTELDPELQKTAPGSTHSDPFISTFHGNNTRRLTNLVTHSPVFRSEILDDDLVHDIASDVFLKESGSYWMTTAQVIDIGPGNAAQPLHRDLENSPPFVGMGPDGPEAIINFLIALTDFTDANGATRVIPGSNHWPDFTDRGEPAMTIPAEMRAGDCLFISGKTVHGGGANRTADQRRRAVAFSFQPGFLTPEEAYPFIVDINLVRGMSPRAQKMIGFRSQFPKGSPGLWQVDYKEIGDHLGL